MDDSKLLDVTSIKLSHTSKLNRKLSRAPDIRLHSTYLPSFSISNAYQQSVDGNRPSSMEGFHSSLDTAGNEILFNSTLPSLPNIVSKSVWKQHPSSDDYFATEHKIAWPENKFPASIQKLIDIQQPSRLNSIKKVYENLTSAPKAVSNTKRKIRNNTKSRPTLLDDKLPVQLVANQKRLSAEQRLVLHDVGKFELKIHENFDSIIDHLPLRYMYNKPNLKTYAIEKSFRLLTKPYFVSIRMILRHYFNHFKEILKYPKIISFPYEKRLGVLVIVKAISNIILRRCSEAFYHWAKLYSTKYNKKLSALKHAAATQIQRWYRHLKYGKNEIIDKLVKIMQACVQRRQAIRYFIRLEMRRARAIEKLRAGVANRRRHFFSARVIQRRYRWVLKFRRVRRRLTRKINARRLQRWIRKMHKRPIRDLLLIRLGMRSGGPTLLFAKMPKKVCKRYERGLIQIEDCIYMIQLFLLKKSGLLKKHILQLKEKKLNHSAGIIQNSYKAYKWRELNRYTKYNNKARRIQRVMKHYTVRHKLQQRIYNKNATKIQRKSRKYFWMKKLNWRFHLRRVLLKTDRRVREESAIKIQRAYREFEELNDERREAIRKQMEYEHAMMKKSMNAAGTIQKAWKAYHLRYSIQRMINFRVFRNKELQRIRETIAAKKIQREYREYLRIKQLKRLQLEKRSIQVLIRAIKSYKLRKAIFIRVQKTRKRIAEELRRETQASMLIKKNWRMIRWLREFEEMIVAKRHYRLCVYSANRIQSFYRRKMREYHMPLRIAARNQLRKKRTIANRISAAKRIQAFYQATRSWAAFTHRMAAVKEHQRRHRALRYIKKFLKAVLARQRFERAFKRNAKIRAEKKEWERLNAASRKICAMWRHHKERVLLNVRFAIRRKILDEIKEMERAKQIAEEDRLKALAAAKAAEDAVAATIRAAWKQGSDANGRNYYYNYVTGESSWTPPPDWIPPDPDSAWVRNADERGNVYYFNMITNESRWLPPCSICGVESQKYCEDCHVAYCDNHYADVHFGEGADGNFAGHSWTNVESTKDKLEKGEVYCHECKVKRATRTCTTCWDHYCEPCNRYVHRVGALKLHKSLRYKDAKKGWYCIKAKAEDEKDYYVNGSTGETTYEKPEELMTESELEYFRNFTSHRKAAEDHVKKIDELQHNLEKMKYDRDIQFVTAAMASVNTENTNTAPTTTTTTPMKTSDEVIENINRPRKKSFFGGSTMQDYKKKLLNSDDRRRGKARSDYIKGLLDQLEQNKNNA